MSEMWELHRRAGELLIPTVRRVADADLPRPTPCTEWNVRDLLHHIAWSNFWVAPLVEGRGLAEVAPTLEGDMLGDDPVGSCVRSIEESSAAFERGGNDTMVQLSRGPTRAREYAAERMNDLTVHTWDLARGIGIEVELDAECMQAALEYFRPYEAMLRPAGELGPDVDVPADADLQTRYLAFFGRRAEWTPPA